jgi:hypothetical protein
VVAPQGVRDDEDHAARPVASGLRHHLPHDRRAPQAQETVARASKREGELGTRAAEAREVDRERLPSELLAHGARDRERIATRRRHLDGERPRSRLERGERQVETWSRGQVQRVAHALGRSARNRFTIDLASPLPADARRDRQQVRLAGDYPYRLDRELDPWRVGRAQQQAFDALEPHHGARAQLVGLCVAGQRGGAHRPAERAADQRWQVRLVGGVEGREHVGGSRDAYSHLHRVDTVGRVRRAPIHRQHRERRSRGATERAVCARETLHACERAPRRGVGIGIEGPGNGLGRLERGRAALYGRLRKEIDEAQRFGEPCVLLRRRASEHEEPRH